MRIPRMHLTGIPGRDNCDGMRERISEEVTVDIFPV